MRYNQGPHGDHGLERQSAALLLEHADLLVREHRGRLHVPGRALLRGPLAAAQCAAIHSGPFLKLLGCLRCFEMQVIAPEIATVLLWSGEGEADRLLPLAGANVLLDMLSLLMGPPFSVALSHF